MNASAPFECRPPEYVTPEGFVDEAFTYVYDTSLLTNGQNYENLAVPIDPGEDFLLRRIEMGGPLAYPPGGQGLGATRVGTFRIKDRLGRSLMGAPLAPGAANVAAPPNSTWSRAIVPEVPYPGGGQIRFDLYNVQNRLNVNSIALGPGFAIAQSQVLFHGVLRKKIPPGREPERKPFRREWYRQVYYPTINWPGYAALGGVTVRLNDTRRFQFAIDDYPFELYGIHVRNTFPYGAPAGADGGSVPPGASISTLSDAALTLYDPYLRARSSGPVLAEYLDTRLSLTQPLPQFNGIRVAAPYGHAYCPPILYPAGGVITLDIQSLCYAVTGLPCVLEIVFLGVIRIPA